MIVGAIALAPLLSTRVTLGSSGTTTLTTCTDNALRLAMAGSGTISLSAPLRVPAGTTPVLDATGELVAFDGGGTVGPLIHVGGGNLTLIGLTLQNASAIGTPGSRGVNTGNGGDNGENGTSDGQSGGAGKPGQDGSPAEPSGSPGGTGGDASGGALSIDPNSLVAVVNCSFLQDLATGGNGYGGAIYNLGALTVVNTKFSANDAIGGGGGEGGPATEGGAIYNGGNLAANNLVFQITFLGTASNQSLGGNAGDRAMAATGDTAGMAALADRQHPATRAPPGTEATAGRAAAPG